MMHRFGRHPNPETLEAGEARPRCLHGGGRPRLRPVFCGSGTTSVVAKELGRFCVGAKMEPEYCELAARRIKATGRGRVLRGLAQRHQEPGEARACPESRSPARGLLR